MEPTPLLPQLARTLSTQHVVVAMAQMFEKGKCCMEAGEHNPQTWCGWTRWFVTRPDSETTEIDKMRLVSLTTGQDGDVSVHVGAVL